MHSFPVARQHRVNVFNLHNPGQCEKERYALEISDWGLCCEVFLVTHRDQATVHPGTAREVEATPGSLECERQMEHPV